jgi:soluble lytic murein transglycosylase-like protein
LATAEALWVAVPQPDGSRVYGFLPAPAVDIVSGHAPRLATGRFPLAAFLAPEPGSYTQPGSDPGAASGLPLGENAPEAAVAAAGAGMEAIPSPGEATQDTPSAAPSQAQDAAPGAPIRAQDAAPGASIGAQGTGSEANIPWLPDTVVRWWPMLDEAGQRHGLDPALLAVAVLVESGGGPGAVSSAGASGLMQVMPATAQDIARSRGLAGFTPDQIWDPATNIDFGAWYLADQWRRFAQPDDPSGEATLALAAAAYNGGPGTVLRHQGGGPLPSETIRYRTWVTGMWRERNQSHSPTFESWWNAGGGALVAAARR